MLASSVCGFPPTWRTIAPVTMVAFSCQILDNLADRCASEQQTPSVGLAHPGV